MSGKVRETSSSVRTRLVVDATNAIEWGVQVPTGIPRLETSIVWEILEHHDDRVGLFCFDDAINRCRMISDGERTFLRKCMKVKGALSLDRAEGLSAWARLKAVFRLFNVGMMRRRETHRAIAQFLSRSRKRAGLKYGLTKIAVRIFVVIARLFRAAEPPSEDPLMNEDIVCLAATSLCSRLARHYQAGVKAMMCIVQYDAVPFDVPQFCSIRPEKYEPAFRFSIMHAKAIISISHHTQMRVMHWAKQNRLPLEGRLLAVVPPASSALDAHPETIIGDPVPGRFIVYCSTIEPRKNHLVLLHALKLLLAQPSTSVPTLVIAGKWGWKYESVEEFLDSNPEVKARVRVMEMVSDDLLAWLYKNALFAVFSSFEEGWGLAASEALEAGTPVLISDIGALREATQGLMPALDPNSPRAWADAIAHYATDSGALAALRAMIALDYKPRSNGQVVSELIALMCSVAAQSAALVASHVVA
jgi:glycosyltransferase involved in cell wall biosynthesis